MAGFDATFVFRPENLGVVRAMNAAAQRRAREMNIRWKSRTTEDGVGYTAMDGWSYGLDVLLERLRRDLPTIAEATPGWRSASYRRRLGNGYVDILTKYRCDWYDRYYKTNDSYVPTLRAIRSSSVWPIHSLWPGSGDQELGMRLVVAQTVMAAWCIQEVEPEVVIEELHTAAELMLKRITQMPDRTKFPDLIREARRKRVFSAEPMTFVYADPKRALTVQQLLKSLLRERNESKHGGRSQAESWLEENFWPIADLLESLSAQV
ncbi:hypothetical protein GQS52_15800 [Streptomyces sp. SCUT-3]|uniref:hypothetical protein n=1 Tax=Streptomyces sp. SCUT-3 TaxID=2684469 RepID=UPI0015FDB3E7|nr:hypothetical protein [Streptomyces sp. SCUT-3]QMV22996.1 hypothetical protein GQS52_15800 [Streptomyces sp. SCUT-3]